MSGDICGHHDLREGAPGMEWVKVKGHAQRLTSTQDGSSVSSAEGEKP